jgi:hypothetical protein
MLLRLFENDLMRHGMRHKNRTVAESTLLETRTARDYEGLIIQVVENLETSSSNLIPHRL